MGGYGSGRPRRKQRAEECRALDVNKLHRDGCLAAGWQGNCQWSSNGEVLSKIGIRAEHRRIVLDYRVRLYGGDWEPIKESVNLTFAACNYGGHRPYFLCPGNVNGKQCRRRVGKLFSGGRYFLCRHCYEVAYNSQAEARYDRMLRRANKLRLSLGGEAGTAHWIAPKPKGMWQRTYQRKRFEIEWREGQADHLFIEKYAKLLSEAERGMIFGSDE